MRVALKIGYIGTKYHGFQIQPEVPTIEGALFSALEKLGIIENRKEAKYSASGRTDKGVHAASQVISFDTLHPKVSPRMINSELPRDIWAFTIAFPHYKFDARRDATSREYRYFLFSPTPNSDLDISRMKEASESFIGVHDFSNFAQNSDGKGKGERYSKIREIKGIEIRKSVPGTFIIIDIEANGFLRKMVRKIVAALMMVGREGKDKKWIEDLLEMKMREEIEAAPAFGLILKNVSYRNSNLNFVEDEYAKEKIRERLKTEILFHRTIAAVLEENLSSFWHDKVS
jgi:tRNA pseudouridine38-40 synthase